MYGFTGHNVEHSVHATGISLSDRFKQVPSHNPLRPNQGVVMRPRAPDLHHDLLEDSILSVEDSFSGGPRLGPKHSSFVGGVNKVSVVRAMKDAEIIRLRNRLRVVETQLKRLENGGNDVKVRRLQINKIGIPVRKRGGGGLVLGQKGRKLNLQTKNAVSLLGVQNANRVSRSPMKNSNRETGKGKLNFFGSPKSKAALDDELDQYMSKCKTKQKTDLDKELDEYMKKARALSFAGKVGLIPSTSEQQTVESEDTEMEVVE